MQVGCYVLHLYCDAADCPRLDPESEHWDRGPIAYTGETGGRCRWQARQAGWQLQGARYERDLCPVCRERLT